MKGAERHLPIAMNPDRATSRIVAFAFATALILAPGAVPPTPAQTPAEAGEQTAGAPPDGSYNCMKISGGQLISLGTLEIRGRTYRGMVAGDFAPFTLETDGSLTLSKGLTGMPDGWQVDSVKYAGKNKQGRPLIRIAYHSKRGTKELIDAVMEKPAGTPAGGAPPPASAPAPDDVQTIADALTAMPDVRARNLLFLKGLAEGKSWDDASAGKRTDPDTLATYESLTPDARKKLALNFARKVTDPAMRRKLADELTESQGTPGPKPAAPPAPGSAR